MVLKRFSLVVALALGAWIGGASRVAADAPPASPADASYGYSLSKAGQQFAHTTVTVKHDATDVALHEVETFTSIATPYTVDETLDPVGLVPTSYAVTFPINAQVTVTAHLTFDLGGAHESVDGTTGSTDLRLEPGTKNQVVIDAALMSGFLMLPAQAKAQSLTTFTSLAPTSTTALSLKVDPAATPARPAGVPARDASLSIEGSVNFIEWYDPSSMVVDEVDVPAQLVTISRNSGTNGRP